MVSPRKSFKSCSSPHSCEPHIGFCESIFKELYMWRCFAWQFTKMALAPSIKLFIDLKQKKRLFWWSGVVPNRVLYSWRRPDPGPSHSDLSWDAETYYLAHMLTSVTLLQTKKNENRSIYLSIFLNQILSTNLIQKVLKHRDEIHLIPPCP